MYKSFIYISHYFSFICTIPSSIVHTTIIKQSLFCFYKISRMTLSFDIPFLALFLILLTSTNVSFTFAAPTNDPKIITDELISTICSQTNNPSLCLANLEPLKGNTYLPKPVAAIGSGSLNKAVSQVYKTADVIWRRYTNTSQHETKLRERLHNCFTIYSVDVKKQLEDAVDYMSNGNGKSVKLCVSSALKRANSCHKNLEKPPSQLTGSVLTAEKLFTDLCSIVLAICSKALKLK